MLIIMKRRKLRVSLRYNSDQLFFLIIISHDIRFKLRICQWTLTTA